MSTQTRLETLLQVQRELANEGAWIHPSMEFYGDNDIEIRVKDAIPANTILMRMPKSVCCKGNKGQTVVSIALALLGETGLVSKSIARYVQCRPMNLDHLPLQYCTSEDAIADWSESDPEFGAMMKAIFANEREEYAKLIKADPHLSISFHEYLYAAMFYNTRAWSDFGLVPLVDMCQHQNEANCCVFSAIHNGSKPTLIATLGAFSNDHPEFNIDVQDPFLVAETSLAAGDKVFISYGHKSMTNMLANYGFVDASRPEIMMSVGTIHATESAKKFIEGRKLMRNYVLGQIGGIHPEFFRVSRMAYDPNFTEKTDYSGPKNLNIERDVVADVTSSLTKYEAALTQKESRIVARTARMGENEISLKLHTRFFSDMLAVTQTELKVVRSNLKYLEQYWVSFVRPLIAQ